MGLILSIFGGTLAKFAFSILENFLGNKVQDAESRKLFLQLADLLRENGVTSVQSRFEAESQLQAGNDAWTKQEQKDAESIREKDQTTLKPPR